MLRKGAKNLTGMRFGALLVMNYAGHFSCGRWKRASWACRCDCGKTKVILGGNLLNGGVRSCGCGWANTFVDLTGKRFGRLTVLSFEGTGRYGHRLWQCQCDCGTTGIFHGARLVSGHTTSCGCFLREKVSSVFSTHKMTKTPEYQSWCALIQRIKYSKHYETVVMSDRWRKFENFFADMWTKPFPTATLDRKDPAKGYCKENCQWGSPRDQNVNRRHVKLYSDGQCALTLSEWSAKSGVPEWTLRRRIAMGQSIVQAISAPAKRVKKRVVRQFTGHQPVAM